MIRGFLGTEVRSEEQKVNHVAVHAVFPFRRCGEESFRVHNNDVRTGIEFFTSAGTGKGKNGVVPHQLSISHYMVAR